MDVDALPVKIFSVDEGEDFLYETLTNKIFRVDRDGESDSQILERLVRRGKISTQILDAPKFSVSFGEYRRALEKNLSGLILEVTRRCNLRCTYCVYGGKFSGQRTHENFDMPRVVMERAIDFFAAHGAGRDAGEISFYGGETLLRADEIFHAIDYAERLMPAKKLFFTVSTNGLLLDEKIFARLVNRPNVAVTVTLNGPPHDKYRRTVDGKATLELLLSKLDAAKKNFPHVWENQIGFICNYADFAEFHAQQEFYLRRAEKMPLLINPIVPPNLSDLLARVDERIFARQKLADDYFRTGDKFLAAYFRVPVAVIHDRPIFTTARTFINSCLPLVNRLFVAADGRFQICTETTDVDGLGSVDSGFNFVRLKKLFDDAEKIFAQSTCRRCWAQRFCPACLKDFLTVDGELKLTDSTFCDGIRATLLCDLKLYCRLAYHRREFLEPLITPNERIHHERNLHPV